MAKKLEFYRLGSPKKKKNAFSLCPYPQACVDATAHVRFARSQVVAGTPPHLVCHNSFFVGHLWPNLPRCVTHRHHFTRFRCHVLEHCRADVFAMLKKDEASRAVPHVVDDNRRKRGIARWQVAWRDERASCWCARSIGARRCCESCEPLKHHFSSVMCRQRLVRGLQWSHSFFLFSLCCEPCIF